MKPVSILTLVASMTLVSACAAGPTVETTNAGRLSGRVAPSAPADSDATRLGKAAQDIAGATTSLPPAATTPATTPKTPKLPKVPDKLDPRSPRYLLKNILPTTAPTSPAVPTAPRGNGSTTPATHSAPTTPATRTAGPWKPRAATYDVVVERDQKITMSDGVVLRADIYRPGHGSKAAAGRFPVVLSQTPYNKTATGSVLGGGTDYLVQRGYVFISADVRGTGSSGGQWDSFGTREQRDGYDLATWATSSSRPWSDGRLGLYGASYMAINQFFTAAQHPKGLKALFPIVPAGDVYRDVMASGGQIDAGFIPLWLGLVTGAGLIPPAVTATEPDAAINVLLQHASGTLGFQVPTIGNVLTGDNLAYDGSFYTSRSPLSVIDKVDVPTFVTGGEYDIFQRGEPMVYDALQKRGVPSRLLIGPWTHVQAAAGGDISGSGYGSLDALALRWFDHYVRGVADPGLSTDVKPVTYYEQGSQTWRTMSSWLGSSIHAKAYGLGASLKPMGTDVVAPNPLSGVCSRSTDQWTAGLVDIPGCSTDNRAGDLLSTSYQTDPLAKDVDIAGPINADLSVSTTGTDGLVSVSVEDVAPDGSVSRLTGGWQTLRQRATTSSRSVTRDGLVLQPWHPFTESSEKAVTPGQVVRVPVEVFPTGAKIAKGHRLRVTIASYDLPHLMPNLKQLVRGVAGVLTIHHSAAQPSRLIVPVR